MDRRPGSTAQDSKNFLEGTEMMKRLVPVLVIVGMLAGIVWAKEFWKEKAYTEWKKKDVARILLDSPWADAETFDLRGLSSSGRAGAQRRYYIRFHSALPLYYSSLLKRYMIPGLRQAPFPPVSNYLLKLKSRVQQVPYHY